MLAWIGALNVTKASKTIPCNTQIWHCRSWLPKLFCIYFSNVSKFDLPSSWNLSSAVVVFGVSSSQCQMATSTWEVWKWHHAKKMQQQRTYISRLCHMISYELLPCSFSRLASSQCGLKGLKKIQGKKRFTYAYW